MENRVAFGFEEIRNQRTMALPPERLRAHDCRAFLLGEPQQSLNAIAKFRRHHEIRVTSKRFIAPDRIRGIRRRFAASSEFRKMNIVDACACE